MAQFRGPMMVATGARFSNRWVGWLAVVVIATITGFALWQTAGTGPDLTRVAVVRAPVGIMGTTCTLVAVVPRRSEAVAQQGLEDAEQALREVDALMSTYINQSEISMVNQSEAGDIVPLSQSTRAVVDASRKLWRMTHGAFDPTCRPLIDVWRAAGDDNRVPSADEIFGARNASSWADFEMQDGGLRKARSTARLDLGGVAKGYAIDRAYEAILAVGCEGVLVDVGGDVRVGGRDDRGEKWQIVVRDPFSKSTFVSFELESGSVCTSGSYERFVEIDGVRYSHILDPRTGMPARRLPSVTVLAADAMTADVWATALSVLGPEGLVDLPSGTEALIIEGDEVICSMSATPAMEHLIGTIPRPPCRQEVSPRRLN